MAQGIPMHRSTNGKGVKVTQSAKGGIAVSITNGLGVPFIEGPGGIPVVFVSGAVGGSAPVNTVAPVITGTLAVGDTLTVSNGTWSNSPTSYDHGWFRADDALGTGFTYLSGPGNTYVLQPDDAGKYIVADTRAYNAAAPSGVSQFAAYVGPITGVGGTSLTPSTLTRTTGATTYPPQVTFTRPVDWIDGIQAVMQRSQDPTFATGVSSKVNTIMSATLTYDFDLDTIASGSWFFRLGAWESGPQPSNAVMQWSNILNVGDVVAPTITSSSTLSFPENAAYVHTLTANEAGIWEVTGGTLGSSVAGSTLTIAAADHETTPTGTVIVRITDYAGNQTSQTINCTVTDVYEYVPTEWATTNGVNKRSYITVTADDEGVFCIASHTVSGEWDGVRSTTEATPDLYQYEITFTAAPPTNDDFYVGMGPGTKDMSVDSNPFLGGTGVNGCGSYASGVNDYGPGAEITSTIGGHWLDGDVITFRRNKLTETNQAWLTRSGTETDLGSVSAPGAGDYVELYTHASLTITLNCGHKPWTKALSGGYAAFDGS